MGFAERMLAEMADREQDECFSSKKSIGSKNLLVQKPSRRPIQRTVKQQAQPGRISTYTPKLRNKKESVASQANLGAVIGELNRDYFLRWRILARIRLFLRPSFRRPLALFLTPTKKPPQTVGE